MNGHNVITALACDHVCNNCSFGQEALMNADGRSACTYISWSECAKIAETVGPILEGPVEIHLFHGFLEDK